MISFGTYLLNGDFLTLSARQAHDECRVCHFDTAQLYQNEERLASAVAAIRKTYVANGQEETAPSLHITTKISRRGATAEAINASLARLQPFLNVKKQGDTVSVLLHWPMPEKVWKVLEQAKLSGLIDRIGVCNHTKADLTRLLSYATVRPCCNQIELHPFVPRKELLETLAFCAQKAIPIEAHTVLAKGKFLDHGLLQKIAQKYSRSVAQVMIRWATQMSAQKLCLSSKNTLHIREWKCVYASDPQYFTLEPEDMQSLALLSTKEPVQIYGAKTEVKSKVMMAFSSSSLPEAIDFLLLESFLSAPTYTPTTSPASTRDKGVTRVGDILPVKAVLSSGIAFKNDKALADVAATAVLLKKDIISLAAGNIDDISLCAQTFPSVMAAPNLTLAVGQRLFAEKFDAVALEKKYRNDQSAVDRAIVALMREKLRVLRSTLLERQKKDDLAKRAKKKKLFCTFRRGEKVDDDGEEDDGGEEEEKAWIDMGLDRPFSDAVLHPEPMPVTVPDAAEFAPFFAHIRSGASASSSSSTFAGPTCAMKKRAAQAVAAQTTTVEKVVSAQTTTVEKAVAAQTTTSAEAPQKDITAGAASFVKGTMFGDGRVDTCKQVVGAAHVQALCDAVRENHVSSSSSATGASFPKGSMFGDGRVDVCKQVVGAEHVEALCDAVRDNHVSASSSSSSAGASFPKGSMFPDGRVDVCKQVVGAEHVGALCDAVRDNHTFSSTSSAPGASFPKGTMFGDGRVDVCKQVVGAQHVGALCDAVRDNHEKSKAESDSFVLYFAKNETKERKETIRKRFAGQNITFLDSDDSGNDVKKEKEAKEEKKLKARHFLLGNNIACRGADGKDDNTEAASHMASLMADWRRVPIETWYLAGNGIGPNSVAMFSKALEQNEVANALWLKRNPIGSDLGPRSLGAMLNVNQHLLVLDLHNCGLFDDGVKALADAATASGKPGHLQFLYLDANGIKAKGARHMSKFLKLNRDVLRGFYVSMNRLGSEGALQICSDLQGSRSLQSLCLDSNSIDNAGLATILEQCTPTWPAIESFSVGYYKATWDMGEQPNFIGFDLPPAQQGGNESIQKEQEGQPQLVPEDRVVQLLKQFIETAPQLKFCSVKGNRFSKEAQKSLADSAWKRAPNFHFEAKRMFARPGETPKAPTMEKLRTQAVKHGPLVVNIDSIYRNTM